MSQVFKIPPDIVLEYYRQCVNTFHIQGQSLTSDEKTHELFQGCEGHKPGSIKMKEVEGNKARPKVGGSH